MRLWTVAVLILAARGAAADADVVSGWVTGKSSAWTADGRHIVTTLEIETNEGRRTVQQLGGSSDGIGMTVLHGPAIPQIGDAITATLAPTAERRVIEMRAGVAPPGGTIDQLPRMEFTRTTAMDSGAPLRWSSSCAFVRYSAEGTTHVPTTDEFDALDASIAEWMTETRNCSYFALVIEEPVEQGVGFDRVNLIKFREVGWPHQPEAGALTTLFYIDDDCAANEAPPCYDKNPRNGEILDADIEVNGQHFAIANGGQSLGSASCQSDIRNTMTHELGHFIGLDHTCHVGGPPRPLDGNGEPVPNCSDNNLPSSVVDATMYNFQDCGETKKATLTADDIAGFCAAYPLADDPGSCYPVREEGGCCTVSTASVNRPSAVNLLLCLAIALIISGRRRTRSTRSDAG